MNQSVTILNRIDLNAAIVSLRSDKIIQLMIKPNITISEQDAREMVDAAGKAGNEKKYPLLIIAGKYSLADKEAREFAASEAGNKYTIAGGFVVKSLAQKLLGNAYLKVNKPVTPTALFDSEEEAVKWLKKFITK